MAQLSDDCFAFGGPMLSVDSAIDLIIARAQPVGAYERVSLFDADGRVLGEDVAAGFPLPPFANSAVDGYAVRFSDLVPDQPTSLPVLGRIEAGAGALALAAGAAARVFTGAVMPEGADTVFMQEDVILQDNIVVLPAGLKRGANMRPAGEDVQSGEIGLHKGARLRPQDVALAAALGASTLNVAQRLRVGVFSTGNELATPGGQRSGTQIYDSNRFMLLAMLRRLGCAPHDLGVLRDDPDHLADALRVAAGEHDLLLTSGGVSTGEADYVKSALEQIGSLTFWRMAIKPGRPVAMGVIDGTPFVGLPGNPVASFVTFAYVVRPLALALMGADVARFQPLPVRAAFTYKKKAGRREFVRASLTLGADGVLEAQKFPREGAGLLSSLTQSDGFVELREHITRVEPGQSVGFLSFASLD
jgi:molybdopterin molybdotransferase